MLDAHQLYVPPISKTTEFRFSHEMLIIPLVLKVKKTTTVILSHIRALTG